MGTRKGDRKRVSGKEGAMVFRMLKGFRRLMLTTAMLFGVGLFLCGNEVKAAARDVVIERTSAGDGFEVKFYPEASKKYEFSNLKITDSTHDWDNFTTTSTYTDGIPNTNLSEDPVTLATLSDKNFISKTANISAILGGSSGKISISAKVDVAEDDVDQGTKPSTGSVNSQMIYTIKAKKSSSDNTKLGAPSYSITVKDGSETLATYSGSSPVMGYAYDGNKYEMRSTDVESDAYYENAVVAGSPIPAKDSSDWLSAGSLWEETVKTSDVAADFYYIPKIASVIGTPIVKYTTNVGAFPIIDDMEFTVSFVNSAEDTNATPQFESNYDWKIGTIIDSGNTFAGIADHGSFSYSGNKLKKQIKLGSSTKLISSEDTPGNATVNLMISKPGESATTFTDVATLSVKAYMEPKSATLNSAVVPITVSPSETRTTKASVISGLLPGAVDPSTTWRASGAVESTGSILESVSITPAGVLTVKAKSTATGATKVKFTITPTSPSSPAFDVLVDVKIISIDATKTKDAINNSERNFITVDHKLDLEAFFKDYVKDSAGGNLNIAPTAIRLNGTDCADLDGMKLKGKKAGTAKIDAWFGATTSGTPDVTGIEIGVFPCITAEYLDSSRTVKVKIPRRVATSYKDSKTISESKGFTLALEDSSGNTLYEYDKTKFQDVISNSSDDSKEYTISASDIESMVTNAASNGKFNSDTTSVKFRVIPRGYKPPKSDKDMKTADSDVSDTCSATVYRVTASGTNFGTTYAYGLSGQNVTLTASPNAGFTFKQWSDGNTSNPRTVTVSSSGTRTFSAVAGERLPGGTGSDNSQLYDDVPKTAESNSAIWLIVFMVFAVIGTTYALYLQLRAATSKNDK